MKKWYLIALLAALPAQAQMMDVMGSMAVQGAMTRGSVRSVTAANSKMADTKIKNAFGVMLDDVFAGIFAALVLMLITQRL